MGILKIVTGDITQLEVDAIVNAADSSLLGGGGVDGAIHRAAGPQLRSFNEKLGVCPTGEARLSPGFHLPAKWVISTVGPIWRGGAQGEAEQLRQCYRNVLLLAGQRGLRSIAFPAISTGIYGYPKQAAAIIALDEMSQFLDQFDLLIACCFTASDAAIYHAVLAALMQRLQLGQSVDPPH
jgi:O-acetyl-ADP-ribose deacetylase